MRRSLGTYAVDNYPEVCPSCHHAIDPAFIPKSDATQREYPTGHSVLTAAFRCRRSECNALFVAYYSHRDISGYWSLFRVMPRRAMPPSVDDRVHKLSPQFIKIYGQALQAETSGLDEIQGVGLRKALEFLIKDYCIKKHPEKAEEVKKTFLAACIKTYITDPNIKACAERATWLGNDETHYARIWTAHDISDLETLIKLTCNWITNELLTQDYLDSMKPNNHRDKPIETQSIAEGKTQ